jgi:hypothetical protein
MTIKNSRHQSVINRQSEEGVSEDHWLRQFEQKLQKTSVQPRGNDSLFDQINTIMNGKSKYPSVQAAVDDMMHRSGLSDYLDNVKTSQTEDPAQPKKVAQQQQQQPGQIVPQNKMQEIKTNPKTPKVIEEKPSILTTLENIIRDSKGNLSVPTIISRLHALHASDITDEAAWDDDRLIRLVSYFNIKAKKDNPANFENFDNLGKRDHSTADSDIDPSNTDAFNVLMPAKL